MVPDLLRFASVMLTAIAMAGGFAHLLELPRKIGMSEEEYLTVQQIYRGWALLGIAVVGALLSTVLLALTVRGTPARGTPAEFYLAVAAALCIVISLIVFFAFTFPANRQTANWTSLPENWQQLRRRWEYSHAVGAALYFLALSLITLSLLVRQ